MRTMRSCLLVAGLLAAHAAMAQIVPPDPVYANAFEDGVVSMTPNPTYVAQGASNSTTLATPLTVTLSTPATSDTFVPIVSAEPSRLAVAGGGATVLTGQSSALVRVDGLEGGAAPVTLTATLGNSVSAGVRVEAALNETDVAAEADFCNLQFPQTFSIGAGEVAPSIYGQLFENGVTDPAGAPAGWIAAVGYGPDGTDPRQLVGWKFYPASYNLQVGNNDEFQANFTAPYAQGNYAYAFRFSNDAGVSWTYCDVDGAGSNAGLDFSVANTGTMTVTPSLVVNEVDYDQPGTPDSTEFIEVYNASAASVNLGGLALVLINGNNNAEYRRIDLSSAGSLAAGAYLVVRDPSVIIAPGAISLLFPGCTGDCVQNGAPDAVALIDTNSLVVMDAASYEGSITAAFITGFPTPVSLVEGSPMSAADGNTTAGSLVRLPNGADTNDASADWALTTTPTPGAANVP